MATNSPNSSRIAYKPARKSLQVNKLNLVIQLPIHWNQTVSYLEAVKERE
jgi:hypothetical protein